MGPCVRRDDELRRAAGTTAKTNSPARHPPAPPPPCARAFFAGFGSSAARSSSVIGRINCASSLATRLTRVETSCQANSPSAGARQQRHHALGASSRQSSQRSKSLGRDGHGHAVVQHAEIGARRRGDDRHGVESPRRSARSRFPPAPPSRSAAPSRRWMKYGRLRPLGILPFVIAVGRDQAAPPPDRVLEGRFFRTVSERALISRREFPGVLDPGRQQAPAHQPEMPDAVFDDHDGYRLGRRNIISRRKIGLLDIAENLPQGRRGRGYDETSAHSADPNRFRSGPFNPKR